MNFALIRTRAERSAREPHARVLVKLTEQVLAVDREKRTFVLKARPREAERVALRVLFGDDRWMIARHLAASRVREDLADAAFSSRARAVNSFSERSISSE